MSIIPDPDRHRRAREPAQPSTLHQFAQSNSDETAGGRFAKQEGAQAQIVGADSPSPQYPAAAPWVQTELPPEEPLGYRIDEMVPLESPVSISTMSPLTATGPASDAAPSPPPPSADDKQRADAGPPSQNDGGSDGE